jgi:hypothetical protein
VKVNKWLVCYVLYQKDSKQALSQDIEGNEIGEIRDEELKGNLMKIIIDFLGNTSTVYGKKVGAWEVKEDTLRLCVEGENDSIVYYACEVESELTITLTVTGHRTLEGDHWSTKLLRGIMKSNQEKKEE